MTAEEIFEKCIGLNAELEYVPIKKEDVIEAMESYHKESSKELVGDLKETLIEYQKFLIKNELMGSNAYYNAELFLKEKTK